MENIKLVYKKNIYFINITEEDYYPHFVYKIDFVNKELSKIITSPAWIEKKGNIFSFTHTEYKTIEQIELLNIFAQAIEENFK